MQTIETHKEYKIEFNGSRTYFVSYTVDGEDTCIFRTNTERKARNFFNSTLKAAGINK